MPAAWVTHEDMGTDRVGNLSTVVAAGFHGHRHAQKQSHNEVQADGMTIFLTQVRG